MKRLILFLFISLIYCNGYTQLSNEQDKISIIPQPVSVSLQKGYFLLKPDVAIIPLDNNSSEPVSFLSELFYHSYGFRVKQNGIKSSSSAKAGIVLSINKKPDAAIGDEGYTLKVNPQQVSLSANKPQGLFYGIQTLMQLLPPAYNSNIQTKNTPLKIQCVNITDYPRFGYRGMMLDVSRHFFPKNL